MGVNLGSIFAKLIKKKQFLIIQFQNHYYKSEYYYDKKNPQNHDIISHHTFTKSIVLSYHY